MRDHSYYRWKQENLPAFFYCQETDKKPAATGGRLSVEHRRPALGGRVGEDCFLGLRDRDLGARVFEVMKKRIKGK